MARKPDRKVWWSWGGWNFLYRGATAPTRTPARNTGTKIAEMAPKLALLVVLGLVRPYIPKNTAIYLLICLGVSEYGGAISTCCGAQQNKHPEAVSTS